MSNNRPNELYNWERFSKPRVHSSSQRIVKDDDIQNWIKKVEDASSMAAAAAFGGKYTPPAHQAKAAVAATVEDARLHDAAYAEAQDLLQQWVSDKIDLSGDDFTEESWTKKTESEIKREWDHLLGGGDRYDADLEALTQRTAKAKNDPYSILKQDEGSLVDDVMQKLLDKEVVESYVLDDLGLEPSAPKRDPRTKMHLRQQQVKDNREKRERDKQKKLKEQHAKKDAQFHARQMITKENQQKAMQQKREEDAIQQEMAKIRKDMDEEKKKNYEQKVREQRERDEFDQHVRDEMQRQKCEVTKDQIRVDQKTEYRKRLIMERLKEMETKEAVDNLKLLQRCFSAWYNHVVQRHLQIGKAKAMSDWKLLLKTFNSWKSYTRAISLEKESLVHEAQVKLMQRKKILAEQHYKTRLLRRCVLAWQLYVFHQHHKKDITDDQSKTKNKMAAFLEAAASGKLWSARSEEGASSRSPELTRREGRSVPKSGNSTARKVDDMFDGATRRVLPPGSARSDTTSASSFHTESKPGGRQRTNSDHVPLQAWQITRKHVEVTKDDLARVESQRPSNTDTGQETTSRTKKPYIADRFENRHAAQQKVLEGQQRQIAEQQRLIQEMRYLQNQQILQQELTQQQLVQQKLGWISGDPHSGKPSGTNTGSVKTGRKKSNGSVKTDITDLTIEDLEEVIKLDSNSRHPEESVTERTAASNTTQQLDNASMVSSAISKTSTDTKHIKFLKSMEERAGERTRIKQERDEKRKQIEAEKLMVLQAEEAEKRKEEEAEKKRRADAYRKKKELERQREEEKQHHLDRMKQLTAVAEEHSLQATLRYRGWLPWRRLVSMAKNDMEKAHNHHKRALLSQTLLSWHDSTQKVVTERRVMADDMFKYILIRRCFNNWKRAGYYMAIEDEKACRHYETALKVKVIREWADYATEEKMAMWKKERLAREHNTKRMVLTAFRAWRRYPRMIEEEQKRQKRLERMRQKVTSILPDFDGMTKSITSSDQFT